MLPVSACSDPRITATAGTAEPAEKIVILGVLGQRCG
jgi:hypothetical protein